MHVFLPWWQQLHLRAAGTNTEPDHSLCSSCSELSRKTFVEINTMSLDYVLDKVALWPILDMLRCAKWMASCTCT
jgi:hypothetical protein